MAKFEDEIGVIGSTFKDSVNFTGCEFNGEALFFSRREKEYKDKKTEFQKAMFGFAKFKSKTNFSSTIFNGKAEFTNSSFVERAYFSNTCFNGNASFKSAEFQERVFFSGARFAELGKKSVSDNSPYSVNFEGAEFYNGFEFKGDSFENDCNFKRVKIEKDAIFENAIIKETRFLETDVGKIEFINCKWHIDKQNNNTGDDSKRGTCMFYDEYLIQEKFKGFFRKMKSFFIREKNAESEINKMVKVEMLNRQVKERAMQKQNWKVVSDWHYREKVIERLRFIFEAKRLKLIGNTLYGCFSGYNEKPLRASFILIVLLLFLSLFKSFGEVALIPLTNFLCEESLLCAVSIKNIMESMLSVMESLPGVKIENSNNTILFKYLIALGSILLYIQVVLLGMSVRNKLRR